MFDVVDALELLGTDAGLVGASSASLDAMLQRQGAEPAIRRALLQGDASTLQTLLRAPISLCPFVHPAEEEEEPEEEENEEGEDEGDDEEDGVNSRNGPKPRS